MYWNYDDTDFLGVYKTKEEAEQACKEHPNFKYEKSGLEAYHIQEWLL